MNRVATIPVMVRRGGRRYTSTFQGALMTRSEVTWRCGHAHPTKLEAQQCAEHEASYLGLPVPLSVGGHD